MGEQLQTISTEEKEKLVTAHLKDFDSEGYMLNIIGVAGMSIGENSLEDRAVIIPVAEEYKKRLFEFEQSLCNERSEYSVIVGSRDHFFTE